MGAAPTVGTVSESSSDDGDSEETRRSEVGGGLLDEEMGPSGAMAHLYRGEIHRMRFWRERLDRTTYWAIVIMAAVLTWAFSNPSNPHYVLLVGAVALGVFLGIEARRYRGYDIWRSRMRTLQRNVFAYGLDPSQGLADPDWRARLSEDYRRPRIKISMEEAVAHRLRRIYLPLTSVVLGAWVVRVTAYAGQSWPGSAVVGPIPGIAVTAAVALTYGVLLVVAIRPREWRAETELLTEDLREK